MDSKKKFIILATVLVLLAILGTFLITKALFPRKEVKIEEKIVEVTPTPTNTIEPTATITITVSPTTTTIAPTPTQKAVPVLFNGTITTSEKTILKARITDPYLEYHRGSVASIDVEGATLSGKKTYKVVAIFFATGNNEPGMHGFLTDMMSNGQVDYWIPECIGAPTGCTFTQEFKTKYPQNYQRYVNTH